MVVPKMDRAKRAPLALTGEADHDYPPASIPALAGPLTVQPAPFLARALAMMKLRGRSASVQPLQLNGAHSADPASGPVNEEREMLLSKITKSLRSRTQESALL
jgi:hypothetical protein